MRRQKSRKRQHKKRRHGGSPTKRRQSISNIPKLMLGDGEKEEEIDLDHIYINLLIDLMGSSLYDAFLEYINQTYELQIKLISYPRTRFELNTHMYVRQNDTPCIFYQSGGEYTHFICTYDPKFDACADRLHAPKVDTILSPRKKTDRNRCDENQFCLWDPYYNSKGSDCTIFAGFQKLSAHSFCQTFTLACMIHQYLPDYPLTQAFSSMQSINHLSNTDDKNEILLLNAFYAKEIACNIIQLVYDEHLQLEHKDQVLDGWDFLFEQLDQDRYQVYPKVTFDNHTSFIDHFIQYCRGITVERIRHSSIISNIIHLQS